MVELQLLVFGKYIHKYCCTAIGGCLGVGGGVEGVGVLCGEVSHLDTPTFGDPHWRDEGDTLSLGQHPAHIHKRDLEA